MMFGQLESCEIVYDEVWRNFEMEKHIESLGLFAFRAGPQLVSPFLFQKRIQLPPILAKGVISTAMELHFD